MLKSLESFKQKPSFVTVTEVKKGFYVSNSLNFDFYIWGRNAPKFYMGYPCFPNNKLNCFGVCDSPEQFINKFEKDLEVDERVFVVSFCHIGKNPKNKGFGGGWRWHKWGPYIGTGQPHHEYLDDEEGFENGVYCYHIYQLEGPELKFEDTFWE